MNGDLFTPPIHPLHPPSPLPFLGLAHRGRWLGMKEAQNERKEKVKKEREEEARERKEEAT